jgi:hypothetical protein
MSFTRPIQWYHSHADPICPDGTFKVLHFRHHPVLLPNIKAQGGITRWTINLPNKLYVF